MKLVIYLEWGGVEPESQRGKLAIIQQDWTSHFTEGSLYNVQHFHILGTG